jgi:hypothetical protein
MDMDWQDAALALAGVIGSVVAVVHGILVQRLMVTPFEAITEQRLAPSVRRLVPPLLHFSTISWFFGGLALITAAFWFGDGARLATGLFVGSHFLFGALVNLWALRGRHPGWMLMAAAVILIAVGLLQPKG